LVKMIIHQFIKHIYCFSHNANNNINEIQIGNLAGK